MLQNLSTILWIDRRSLISSGIFVSPVELAPREGIVTQVSSSKGGIGYLDNPFAKFATFVPSPADTFHTPRLDMKKTLCDLCVLQLCGSTNFNFFPCHLSRIFVVGRAPENRSMPKLVDVPSSSEQKSMCSFQIFVNVFFAHPKLWTEVGNDLTLNFQSLMHNKLNHQCMHHENWHVSIIKSVVSGIKLSLWRPERPRWMPHPPHRWVGAGRIR